MKKFTITTMLAAFFFMGSFSQETKNVHIQLTREDYLKKSKTQKITAWVLLGVGLATIAIVAPGNSSFETTGAVSVIGVICIGSSIPLFIASGKNRRKAKAATVFLNLEKISNNIVTYKTYYVPALSIKFNF